MHGNDGMSDAGFISTISFTASKAGVRGPKDVSEDLIIQIAPNRVALLDQLEFPGSPPFLDALFAENRVSHGGVKFDIHEPVDAISLGEAIDDVASMFPGATAQVARYPDVERTITATGEDVDAWLHQTIMARLTGSLDSRLRGSDGTQ